MNRVLKEVRLPTGQVLQLVQGDLTTQETDAIVNAANENLQHGGGVAGAIVRRGGQEIQKESDAWVQVHGPVSHDSPAFTTAGRLPSRYVIHAVGPVWRNAGEDAKKQADANLAAAVKGSLRRADQLGLATIALPAISTGIFGFPKNRAAGVIIDAIEAYFQENGDSGLKQVRLVLYDHPTLDAFSKIWEEKFPGSG